MKPTLLLRIALGYLALSSLQIGVWALAAPRSFYDSFPGLGRTWVAIDGPYNEHLVRDFGALNLALALVVILAAVRLSRDLIQVAGLATLAWGIPHLAYHLFNRDGLSVSDQIVSFGGLIAFVALAGLILAIGPRLANQAIATTTEADSKLAKATT